MSNLRILKHFKTTFSGKYFKGTFEILLKTPISNYIHKKKKKKMPICFLHFSDEKKMFSSRFLLQQYISIN